ncbi:MAG: carboxymethylenebutenolidase [Arenicella sp.]|jgi:carboxymethylenebutenolidase
MHRSMDKSKLQHDFVAAAKYLKGNASSNGKLGAVGFCYGGYIVNYLAAIESNLLDAGVPFYGTPASPELRGNITARLLVQLGELDERVNNSWPDYKKYLDRLNETSA